MAPTMEPSARLHQEDIKQTRLRQFSPPRVSPRFFTSKRCRTTPNEEKKVSSTKTTEWSQVTKSVAPEGLGSQQVKKCNGNDRFPIPGCFSKSSQQSNPTLPLSYHPFPLKKRVTQVCVTYDHTPRGCRLLTKGPTTVTTQLLHSYYTVCLNSLPRAATQKTERAARRTS